MVEWRLLPNETIFKILANVTPEDFVVENRLKQLPHEFGNATVAIFEVDVGLQPSLIRHLELAALDVATLFNRHGLQSGLGEPVPQCVYLPCPRHNLGLQQVRQR